MRIDKHPEFITEEERLALIDWMDNSGYLVKGFSRGEYDYELRYNTRLHRGLVVFPKVAYDIQKRIMELYGFKTEDIDRAREGSGMVAVKTFVGGDTHKHTDHTNSGGHAVRLNVLLQKPDKGGVLHIEGERVDLEERELHGYMATAHEHWVTEVEGDNPRHIWIFGFEIDKDNWEK